MPHCQLFQEKNWLFDENQKPCQYCIELLEYSKDNYWHEDKMTDQIVNFTTRIFSYAFSDRQAFFAFNNAGNNVCYAENAFSAKKMNLSVGEKQLRMGDGFNNAIQQT